MLAGNLRMPRSPVQVAQYSIPEIGTGNRLVETAPREFGGRLRAARLARNITLEAVADKIGTGRRAVMDASRSRPIPSA